MKKLLFAIASLSVAMMTGCNDKNDRTVTSLNGDGWKFSKDATCKLDASAIQFDDSKWQSVEVPHDWAIYEPFDMKFDGNQGALPWRGVGWYRTAVKVSAQQMADINAGGAYWLEFDGVMARPQVYVNGKLAGAWDYGYMSFRVDASGFMKEGDNVIAVRADTREHFSRWYPGAGIYRSVRIVKAPAVHVVPGTEFVTTPKVDENCATVRVQFTVTNRLDKAASVSVAVCTESACAKKSDVKEIAAKAAKDFTFEIPLNNPKLWDIGKPNLYTAEIKVDANGKADVVPVRFGVRSFKFTADDGFHLNGRRVQLKGVNLHADLGPLGMAFNKSVMKRQLAIMMDMGVNSIRTSHNAPDPQLLDLCDELGLVVWNECFDKWNGTASRRNNENLEEYVVKNLKEFVKRDRNHPCVVIWSIGNEIPPLMKNGKVNDKDGTSRARCKMFREAIRSLDTTRPVGIGECFPESTPQNTFADLDITGWNYREQYIHIKKYHPNKPTIYSESASALSSYGYYMLPPPAWKTQYATNDFEVCSYDHNAAPWSDIPDLEFYRMERDSYCAGEFVWTGIDYLGEPTPYSHHVLKKLPKEKESRSSYFGIVDLMGIAKDRFYLYRSYWNKDSETIHILPHWNWAGKEGKTVPVYVYTSGDSAELFLNGKSLGKRAKKDVKNYDSANFAKDFGKVYKGEKENPYYEVVDKYRLRWNDVVYQPGELKVVAYRDGKKIGEKIMRTAEKAECIQLTPEEKTLPADGETYVFVQVDVTDAKGVRDPLAKNMINFSLTGPGKIVSVGNADPRGLKSFKETANHPLYFGKAVVVVRREKGGMAPIVLKAEAQGLKPATVEFK